MQTRTRTRRRRRRRGAEERAGGSFPGETGAPPRIELATRTSFGSERKLTDVFPFFPRPSPPCRAATDHRRPSSRVRSGTAVTGINSITKSRGRDELSRLTLPTAEPPSSRSPLLVVPQSPAAPMSVYPVSPLSSELRRGRGRGNNEGRERRPLFEASKM